MAKARTQDFWNAVWAWYLTNDCNVTQTCKTFEINRSTFYQRFGEKDGELRNAKKNSVVNIIQEPESIEDLSVWYTRKSIALEKARINNLIAMNETFQILTKRINEDIKIHGKTNVNTKLYESIASVIANKKQININYTDNSLSLNDNRAVNNLQNNNNMNNQSTNSQLSGRDALMKALASDDDDLDSVDEVRPVIELDNNSVDNNNDSITNNDNNLTNIIEESQSDNGSNTVTNNTTENNQ